MAYMIIDTRSRLIFNRESVSHHGVWLTHNGFAPTFDTPDQAMRFGTQNGFKVGTFEAMPIIPGKATTSAMLRCERCGGDKRPDQSCGCFDNGGQ